MRHRLLSLLLIAALLMGTAGLIPVSAADGWSASYRSYVPDGGYLSEDLEYDSDPGPLFTLYDVDADGQPELIAFNNLGGHAPAPSSAGFSDVSPNSYCADAVAWAVENGITNGTSATTFSPDDDCTRQQVVTFLWRAMGAPAPTSRSNPFTDVTGNYAYDAILWAVENGVTNGVSTDRFGPKTVCTREQVVTFLYRALDQPYFENQHNPFSDVSSAGYAYEPILWAVENSVTRGTGTGVFSPRATCTRGQIVTFLYRALS